MDEHLEMIYQWHQGRGYRKISRSLHMSRKTIGKYVRLLMREGVERDRPLPPREELARLIALIRAPGRFDRPAQELLKPHHGRIAAWLEEPYMTIQQVQRLLKDTCAVEVSYMSLHRYVRRSIQPRSTSVTVRLHTPAGQQGQVDFGSVGLMRDPETGRRRKAWAFIMVLSYSRHRFVRFVFRQDSRTWIDCHLRAFEFFRSCPKTILLDNLKDGVIKPDVYDPTLNQAYAELERHFGFVADPAKVAMARHKGKVERQVPVVRQQLIAGRTYRDIDEANEFALYWSCEEIGRREHGTTHRKPYEVFLAEEVSEMLPLPEEPFESARWKRCRIHDDCHLIYERSFYSAPYRFRGHEVWVRADEKMVRIYLDHQLIKVHLRAHEPGTWRTDETDYPPDKLAFLEKTPGYCRSRAARLGPHVAEYVQRILSDHAIRNLRKAQAVLRFADRYGQTALEQSCRRALYFANFRHAALKQILEKELWRETWQPPKEQYSTTSCRFVRPADYFVRKEGIS